MENFVFSSRARITTLSLVGVGVLCLLLSFFADGGEAHHMRFWTNFLHNTVFFLGIAAFAGFALTAFTTAYAGWFVAFKRVWETFSAFLLPGMFLMGVIIVGLWLHSHHLYHWNDAEAVEGDAILTNKSSFLNKWWYTFGTIGFVGIWYFLLGSLRNISADEDADVVTNEYKHYKRYKKYAAIFLPIFGYTSAAMIWQWVMSIDSHWYSTMFAWYASASLFVAMTALTIMLLIYLKSRGYYTLVNQEHFHDLGKYLFAISIFWAYLWFSQFMLIWYANVGEETIYFRERMDNYPVLFWANLVINLGLPFFILMRNDTKRKMGTLFFAAAFVFFGHWLDYFNMIKPGARLTIIELAEHKEGEHGSAEEHATMDHHNEEAGVMSEAEHAADEEHAAVNTEDAAPEQRTEGMNVNSAGLPVPTDPDNQRLATGAETVESGIPVATEFRGGGPEGSPEATGPSDIAVVNTEDEMGSVFEPNHYIQEENIEETEMIGHLDAAVGEEEGETHTLGYKSGYTLPGLLEIGTFLGFLGGFLFFVLSQLTKVRLEPKNDPYIEESIHHHT